MIHQLSQGDVRLLSARQVATLLGCSWQTVRRLTKEGKLPKSMKLFGMRRWMSSDIENVIQELAADRSL